MKRNKILFVIFSFLNKKISDTIDNKKVYEKKKLHKSNLTLYNE